MSVLEEGFLKSATIPDYLIKILSAVEELKTDGFLCKGNANALISKINNAIKSYTKGNISSATNHLSIFKTSVNNLIDRGILTQEQGDLLTDLADDAILLLKGSFMDIRDGNVYPVTLIGDQIWMARNLAYLPAVNPLGEYSFTDKMYYVYNYSGNDIKDAKATQNYVTYGALYNWAAAMNNSSSSWENPSGVQGACPNGWHLPSHLEWSELSDFVGGGEIAGNNLREAGDEHWIWYETNTSTDEYGFTALPSGEMAGPGSGGPTSIFCGLRQYCVFWSSSQTADSHAYSRFITDVRNRFDIFNYCKYYGGSIRCIKN